jgi:hypothetical protein
LSSFKNDVEKKLEKREEFFEKLSVYKNLGEFVCNSLIPFLREFDEIYLSEKE